MEVNESDFEHLAMVVVASSTIRIKGFSKSFKIKWYQRLYHFSEYQKSKSDCQWIDKLGNLGSKT